MNSFRTEVDLVIKNASQVLTIAENCDDIVGLLKDRCIAVKGEKILFIGDEKELDDKFSYNKNSVIHANNKVVLPGFIDSHTHVVFGGTRVKEYVIKVRSDDPKELERNHVKTGIMASVEMTRALSKEELIVQTSKRLDNMLKNGTTTVESKSGYGLSIESEIKMLEVNKELDKIHEIDIISTFLGAHGWPEDIKKEKYIDLLITEMIPEVARLKLAKFNDIWCDEGHFNVFECEKILGCGVDYKLKPKIHTEAYSYIGGADLAASMNMVSADHLNYTPRKSLKKLKENNVVGVLLPAIDFAVKHQRIFDPNPMIEEGMDIALATNCCPGCYCESMPFVLTLACRNHGMSVEHAIKASTLGGAKSLCLKDRGQLLVGKLADIQIWDIDNYEEVVYRLGSNVVETVIKNGKVVFKKES